MSKLSENYTVYEVKPKVNEDSYTCTVMSNSDAFYMVVEVVYEKIEFVEKEVLWDAKNNIGFYTCIIMNCILIVIFSVLKVN